MIISNNILFFWNKPVFSAFKFNDFTFQLTVTAEKQGLVDELQLDYCLNWKKMIKLETGFVARKANIEWIVLGIALTVRRSQWCTYRRWRDLLIDYHWQ